MTSEQLDIRIEQQVARVTLNQPETLNALTPQMLAELIRTVEELDKNPAVHVIILTGSGNKAFGAGGDVAYMQPLAPAEARDVALTAHQLFQRMEASGCVIIGAINGYALGGGCELAMACDIRVAARHAKLGQPEIKLGIIPGWGGTQRLARLIGPSRAKELMFTGVMISADEAKTLGLVDHVTEAENLLIKAQELADQIAAMPNRAIRQIKEAVNNGLEMDMDKACRYEAELFAQCFATADQKEGMLAFLEKRPANWCHR
ncbi:MAG: enoyl-CoA hydratase/isomerase family protein [Desulfuromonadaceae bacterium]|nr:enoyl-CoA hydratase/isomerase family protein [Desulfuromonadaceae bacterium]